MLLPQHEGCSKFQLEWTFLSPLPTDFFSVFPPDVNNKIDLSNNPESENSSLQASFKMKSVIAKLTGTLYIPQSCLFGSTQGN